MAGRGTGLGAAAGSSKSAAASAAIAGRRRQYQTPAPAAASPASSHAQIGAPPAPPDGDAAAPLSDGGATATGAVGSFENPGAAVADASSAGCGVSAGFADAGETGAESIGRDAGCGWRGGAVADASRRAGAAAADGVETGRAGCVATTGGAGVGAGVGAGAGVGVGVARSRGPSGGILLSVGPCTPGVRPSFAGGSRKVEEGVGVGAGVSACCAVAGMISASDAANAPSDNRAALSLCPIVRTVILIPAIPRPLIRQHR